LNNSSLPPFFSDRQAPTKQSLATPEQRKEYAFQFSLDPNFDIEKFEIEKYGPAPHTQAGKEFARREASGENAKETQAEEKVYETNRVAEVDAELNEQTEEDTTKESYSTPNKPTGLLGEIAAFIYNSSLYPVEEVALAGAIALMAGICGRAFNTNGSGLNQYIVLLADTGQGKEAAASGISKLSKAIRNQVPAFDKFIGPSEIASPQALLKYLGKESNSFFSHKGEMGFWLQKLNDKYAKANETSLKAMLLDVYHKSGSSQVLQGSIYSDNTKNAPIVYAPALTLFGDSTPQEFYKALDERSITDGLISRFTVIQCNGLRPVYNRPGASLEPDPGLVSKLATLARYCLQNNETNSVWVVTEDEQASKFHTKYEKECNDKVWADREDPIASIWNRALIKVLRLGALVAIGNSMVTNNPPLITLQDYLWAKDVIERGIRVVQKRFESGDVGDKPDAAEQSKAIENAIVKFCKGPYKEAWQRDYHISREQHKQKIFTFRYIHAYTKHKTCFLKRDYLLTVQPILKALETTGHIAGELGIRNRNGVASVSYKVLHFKGLYSKEG
jgi:hypothetical protein